MKLAPPQLTDAESTALLAELDQVGSLDELQPRPVHGVGNVLRLSEVRTVHRQQVTGRTFEDWRGRDSAVAQLKRLPAAGEIIHAITDGTYRGVDLIPAILKLADAAAVELIVSTLSFSTGNIDVLCRLLDEKQIRRAALVCSVYFRRTSEAAYTYAVAELSKRNVQVTANRVHAKIILLRTNAGHHIVVESSANLRSCLCTEQVAVSDDRRLYQFHRCWLQHVITQTQQEAVSE